MKLKERPRIELLYDRDNLIIPFQKGQVHSLNQIIESVKSTDKEVTVEIKTKYKKRSLDANAYLWVLIGKLGAILYKPDSEIYREYIRDNGVFEIVPIRKDAITRWRQIWESKGLGWVCEDMGSCKNTPGYNNLKCYYGSSTYNTKEMSRLIDAVVKDCKEQGIETLPPDEIERMVTMWKDT